MELSYRLPQDITRKLTNYRTLTQNQSPTENILLDIFEHLKRVYFNLTFKKFEILDKKKRPIRSFKRFLNEAIKKEPFILVKGKGKITTGEGKYRITLVLRESDSLIYKLDIVSDLCEAYNEGRDGSCNSCEQVLGCSTEGRPLNYRNRKCPDYDPFSGSDTLSEIIEKCLAHIEDDKTRIYQDLNRNKLISSSLR